MQFGYGDKFTDPKAVEMLETKFGIGSGGPQVFKVAKTVKHAPSLLKKLLSWATTAGATGGTLGAIKSLQDRID